MFIDIVKFKKQNFKESVLVIFSFFGFIYIQRYNGLHLLQHWQKNNINSLFLHYKYKSIVEIVDFEINPNI